MLNELTASLRRLRQPGMALALEAWVANPANADRCALECVQALVDAQQQVGQSVRIDRFLRSAGLPAQMTLANFEPGAARGLPTNVFNHLASLAWLDRRQNLVLTGCSRSGKTHLACALVRQVLLKGRTAHYAREPDVLASLHDGNHDGTFKRVLHRLGRPDVLVLDDFAVEHASQEDTYLLRRLVDHRERTGGAMIIASTNAVEDWDGYFADAAAASGIFGRVLSQAHEIVLQPRPTKPSKQTRSR